MDTNTRAPRPGESEQRTSSGAIDTPEQAAEARRTYDPGKYQHPSVTVDVVILTMRDDRLDVLLVKRRHWPFEGMWAIPGGFVEPEEDIDSAARRELHEETAVTDVVVEQFHTFGAPHRDPRGRTISVAHLAFVPPETSSQAGDDAAETRWFPLDALPPLAFDHADILAEARAFLRARVACAPVGRVLLPATFTLRTYLHVLGAIAGQPFDRAEIRKRLLANGVLTRVGATAGAHALYQFASNPTSKVLPNAIS